jgi:hypothetical protein
VLVRARVPVPEQPRVAVSDTGREGFRVAWYVFVWLCCGVPASLCEMSLLAPLVYRVLRLVVSTVSGQAVQNAETLALPRPPKAPRRREGQLRTPIFPARLLAVPRGGAAAPWGSHPRRLPAPVRDTSTLRGQDIRRVCTEDKAALHLPLSQTGRAQKSSQSRRLRGRLWRRLLAAGDGSQHQTPPRRAQRRR